MATKLVQDTSLTSVANAIRVKGEISGTLEFPDGFVTAIQNIPTGGGGETASQKQINFIDYDGTILYSYTSAEWADVSSLPDNPSHSGLTSQGWNWTKAQIDSQLSAMPDGDIWVGQMYVTDDGKTRLYVHLGEKRLHPYLKLCPNGTVTVDWGDGSATSTMTGTSESTVKDVNHVYSDEGDYVITLTATKGSFSIYGANDTYEILSRSYTSASYIHEGYANCLRKVELGDKVKVRNYAFQNCRSLMSITMPSGITDIGNYAFRTCRSLLSIVIPPGVTSSATYSLSGCYSLRNVAVSPSMTSVGQGAYSLSQPLSSITIPHAVTTMWTNAFNNCSSLKDVVIPSGVTSIPERAFNSCESLASITIPSGVTSIGNNAFAECRSLASVTIPSGVTSIGTYAFSNCYSMEEYHLLPTTPPTLGATNAFNNIQSHCKIYVPSESLSAYQTATYWSTYASKMVGE